MTILHYTLGLSPQRSGGLTKYATDLIQVQQADGHNTYLLYPSGWRWWSRQISWCDGGIVNDIKTIKLKNSAPIPILFGVKYPKDIIHSRSMSIKQIESLYNELKPDVFHVHTLMGLPKELLEFFKSKGVKLIYTSHDYYGICPKVNFINHKGELCNTPSAENCKACNVNSKPTIYLRLRNSAFALNIKNNPILRKILR